MKYNRAYLFQAIYFAMIHTTEQINNSQFKNVNLGESPIYYPTRSQKIKSKRIKKRT